MKNWNLKKEIENKNEHLKKRKIQIFKKEDSENSIYFKKNIILF